MGARSLAGRHHRLAARRTDQRAPGPHDAHGECGYGRSHDGARGEIRHESDQGETHRRARPRSCPRAFHPGRATRRLVGSRCQSRLFDRPAAGAGSRTLRATRAAPGATAAARARGRSARLRLVDSHRGGRKHPFARGTAGGGRAIRCRQHQARQVRRSHRGAHDGRGSAAARARSDGRHDDRHESRDGARFHTRPTVFDRRSRRSDLSRQGPLTGGRLPRRRSLRGRRSVGAASAVPA